MGEGTARGAVFLHCNYGAVRCIHSYLAHFSQSPLDPKEHQPPQSLAFFLCTSELARCQGPGGDSGVNRRNDKRAEEATDSVGVSPVHQEHG